MYIIFIRLLNNIVKINKFHWINFTKTYLTLLYDTIQIVILVRTMLTVLIIIVLHNTHLSQWIIKYVKSKGNVPFIVTFYFVKELGTIFFMMSKHLMWLEVSHSIKFSTNIISLTLQYNIFPLLIINFKRTISNKHNYY